MIEAWKNVDGFDNIYQVSNKGGLRSVDRVEVVNKSDGTSFTRKRKGKLLKLSTDRDGYLVTSLSSCGKLKNVRVHRLVAIAFIPNPYNLPEVNHKDGNKNNNHVENLEWVTEKENISHAVDNSLRNHNGENNPKAKLTWDEVRFIRDNYKPRHKKFGGKPLAKAFNVHPKTIYDIAKGYIWNE